MLGQTNQIENCEIKVMLRRAGALPASSLPKVIYYARYLWSLFSYIEKIRMHCIGEWTEISDDRCNMLLVVATLLMTVTYQGVLSPPGGLWQDNDLSEPNTTTAALSPPSSHRAGSTIAGTESSLPFRLFLGFNSAIFLSAIAATYFLVTPVGLGGAILAGVSVSLYYCYFNSLIIITHAPDWTVNFVMLLPLTILLVVAALIFALKGIGYLRNLRRN